MHAPTDVQPSPLPLLPRIEIEEGAREDLLALLNSWLTEPVAEEECAEKWREFQQAIDADRMGSRKLYP